jgi:hypothetical protein
MLEVVKAYLPDTYLNVELFHLLILEMLKILCKWGKILMGNVSLWQSISIYKLLFYSKKGNTSMKTFIFIIFISLFNIVLSQTNFTLEWQSPSDKNYFWITNWESNNNVPEILFTNVGNEDNLYVYDGATKTLKHTFSNVLTSFYLESSTFPDKIDIDVNNDNINEFILRSISSPYWVQVINGSNGAILFNQAFGSEHINDVFTLDIDGDGFTELIVTSYETSLPDKIYIYSTTAHAIGVLNNQNQVKEYNLNQNYPNPFNPSTTIEYSIAKEANVQIILYNELGQQLSTIFDGVKKEGKHKVQFDGSNYPSGVYFYQILVDGNFEAKKMVLIK